MEFNLKNYNDIQISSFFKKGNPNDTQKIAQYVSKKFNNFNFIQVINILKNNQVLAPSSDYRITVNFENFSDFRKLIFNTKKIIHNSLHKIKFKSISYPESSWSIDFKNSIHLTNNIYSIKTSFTEFLNKNLTANEVLNYTFLHELGHSIHSHMKQKTGLNFSSSGVIDSNIQKFLNESIPFKDLNSLGTDSYSSTIQGELKNDLSLLSHYGMKEGFADLYACIAVSLIYPKLQAENIIQTVFDGREYSDKWNKEFYHSKDCINQFLTDFQSNNIQFNNFTDTHSYIEKTISNNIFSNLTKEINNKSDNDNFVNHYFGVLKNKLKPKNCESLNDITNHVNQHYDLSLKQRTQNDFFTKGFNSANKSSPNPQISLSHIEQEPKSVGYKIASLRDKILNNPISNPKNKI